MNPCELQIHKRFYLWEKTCEGDQENRQNHYFYHIVKDVHLKVDQSLHRKNPCCNLPFLRDAS